MTTQLGAPVSKHEVEALSAARQEPQWLAALRAEAADLSETLEWPKPEKMRIDRWNLTALGSHQQADALTGTEQLPEAIQALLSGEGTDNLVVQRNSNVVLHKLSDELKAKGVIFTDLETAAREHAELLQPHLFSLLKKDEDKLTALHAALWNGGVFLYVPKNVELEAPLQAIFYQDNSEASFAPHVVIVADTHSKVTYVEHVVSAEGASGAFVHHGGAEIIAKPGSTVRYASIHNLNAEAVDVTQRRAVTEQDARVEIIIGDLTDGNILTDTAVILKGNGSTSDTQVISVGGSKQQMSLTTRAVHFGRSSDSNMITRAVMREQGTAIINGITKIEKGATKANGVQTERVLMLSPKARGDANPILLIDEDDVTAGHAASVGQVNAEQIFYLMSRGISKTEAERLIIRGFLAPIVDEIPIETVRQQLEMLLERKLGS